MGKKWVFELEDVDDDQGMGIRFDSILKRFIAL